MSHNQFQFIGNVTKPARITVDPAGDQEAKACFDLVVPSARLGADGRLHMATDHFQIECCGGLAINAAKYLGLDSLVFAQGHIESQEAGCRFVATNLDFMKHWIPHEVTNKPEAVTRKHSPHN